MTQFLKRESLTTWDISSITIYTFVTIFIYYLGENKQIEWYNTISMYSFGTPLFLYLFNYKSLRNLYVFIFWFIISLTHIYMYSKFSVGSTWTAPNGANYFDSLQFNWVFLIYFQLARFIHLKINKNELVGPAYGGNYDLIDDKKIDFLDYFFFIIFAIIWILLIPIMSVEQ